MPKASGRSAGQLDMELLDRAARALKVLAHPLRLKMIELLLNEELSVGELAEAVDQPAAAVSQHLNMMRAHGLVQAEREGRHVYYKVLGPQAYTVIGCLRKNRDVL